MYASIHFLYMFLFGLSSALEYRLVIPVLCHQMYGPSSNTNQYSICSWHSSIFMLPRSSFQVLSYLLLYVPVFVLATLDTHIYTPHFSNLSHLCPSFDPWHFSWSEAVQLCFSGFFLILSGDSFFFICQWNAHDMQGSDYEPWQASHVFRITTDEYNMPSVGHSSGNRLLIGYDTEEFPV